LSESKALSVSDAQACVLAHVAPGEVEDVALDACRARVLAEAVQANRDQPPYDVSAMDGYALRSADVARANATLKIVEDIKAGDLPVKALAAGECARIMTGAPLPQGADCVLRVEDTRMVSDALVEIGRAVDAGNDVRFRGEAMRDGDVVLTAGTEITPGVAGVLATVKRRMVKVYRRPSVAILATGDELEDLDEPVDPNKIPNSNSYALMAQAQALGVEPSLLGIARDDPGELAGFLRRGLASDVLLVSGGSSVGVHDHVRPALEALGVTLHFWRVEMRPGHPLAFGTTADGRLVFGLPGNPVSSMVCFEHFVLPALRRMMGHARLFRRTINARLAQAVKIRPGRTEFVRVTLTRDASGYVATSTGAQSSGMLLSMAQAEGLLVVPAQRSGIAAGENATVVLLDGGFQNEKGFED
jgi:molybdopterin molybdotransferase